MGCLKSLTIRTYAKGLHRRILLVDLIVTKRKILHQQTAQIPERAYTWTRLPILVTSYTSCLAFILPMQP